MSLISFIKKMACRVSVHKWETEIMFLSTGIEQYVVFGLRCQRHFDEHRCNCRRLTTNCSGRVKLGWGEGGEGIIQILNGELFHTSYSKNKELTQVKAREWANELIKGDPSEIIIWPI